MVGKDSERWGLIRLANPLIYAVEEAATLQRTYSVFPDGLPGVGLLLLRAAVGTALTWYGGICLMDGKGATVLTQVLAVLSVAIGLFLFLGYLTPLVSVFAVVTSSGSRLAWPPPGNLDTSGTSVGSAFVIIIAVALACLGPGAFSLDARRYGRREIVIPPRPRPSADD